MIRYCVFVVALISSTPASAQSFSCRIGTKPACLDYGDKVCSSMGKCVDANAACFDSYQCDYEGFTCASNVSECRDHYEELLAEHNELVDDFNDLLESSRDMRSRFEDAELCVSAADSIDEARDCFW